MTNNNLKQSLEDLSDEIKESVELQIEIAETLNNLTRVRILLLLWAYKEQSIKGLCKKLGKSWPTITKHLGELLKAGLLDLREVKARGKYNKKIYSVKPDILSLTRLKFEILEKLAPNDVLEILMHDLVSDAHTINILKKIFEDMLPYYEELARNLREIKKPEISELKEFYVKKHVNYYVDILDDDEFNFYHKKFNNLLKELEEYRKNKKAQGAFEENPKPYAALHMILPIKQIQEARYKRRWTK